MMPRELLSEKNILIVDSRLATVLGTSQTLVLMQLGYWLKHSGKKRDGKLWIYKSVKQWRQQDFPFMSEKTIQRTLNELEKKELIIPGNFNKNNYDRTKWYAINRDKVTEIINEGEKKAKDIMSEGDGQSVPKSTDIMSQPIPEITTENKDSKLSLTELDQTQAKTPEKDFLKDFGKDLSSKQVEERLTELKSAVSERMAEHKLSEKYLLTDSALINSLRKAEESEANDTSFKDLKKKGFKMPFQVILNEKATVLPVPEFSIHKKVDKTSFLKILFGYIKRYERFPTEDEMKWIQEARKGAKKPFSPSEIEQAMDLQIKDGSTAGFVDIFTTYLWNARTNYAVPKKKPQKLSTVKENDIPVISDFSDFD